MEGGAARRPDSPVLGPQMRRGIARPIPPLSLRWLAGAPKRHPRKKGTPGNGLESGDEPKRVGIAAPLFSPREANKERAGGTREKKNRKNEEVHHTRDVQRWKQG